MYSSHASAITSLSESRSGFGADIADATDDEEVKLLVSPTETRSGNYLVKRRLIMRLFYSLSEVLGFVDFHCTYWSDKFTDEQGSPTAPCPANEQMLRPMMA